MNMFSQPALAELLAPTVQQWCCALADAGTAELPDSALVDLMHVLEKLKSAAAAVQARAAAAFDASQRRAQSRAGVPAAQLGRGVAAQIALARRDSPHRGNRHLGFGKALVHEMPHTLAALSSGVLSEWRATLLVRETACLDAEDRTRADALICKNPAFLEGSGDRRLIARIRSVTQSMDPVSQVRRNAKAVADRYVSCRPAPDTTSYLTGLLPVAQGVAVFAALSRAADSLRAAGDERGRGQIMADTLVERVTGQGRAGQVPVEVQLVLTDRTLLDPGSGAPDSAHFPGYGSVPGGWARELIGAALKKPGAGTRPPRTSISEVTLRRLYADPVSGELVAMESRARQFPPGLARLIRTRDQSCRTPWCDAPIRHIDHIRPHAENGPTSYTNGQGLCEACNQAKEAPGWKALSTRRQGKRHTVRTITPTGHAYISTAPALPGTRTLPRTPSHPRT